MTVATEIRVRVVPDPTRAGELAGETLTERFADRVRELGESLGLIANDLRSQLDATLADDEHTGWGLEEIALTFTLDLEAEAGVVIAKAKTAAGFDAELKWKRRHPS